MKAKFVALVAALVAGIVVASAPAASALPVNNTVVNAVQPSNYAIGISNTNPYSFDYNLWPQQRSANTVQCFKPQLTSHSYWGGIYWGGEVRCFQTSNNTLTLYSGLP